MDACTYYSTLAGAANATISNSSAKFYGAIVYGSAGGTTLSIYDKDGGALVATINASSLDSKMFLPAKPIALTSGLAATASGTGGYTLFYALGA